MTAAYVLLSLYITLTLALTRPTSCEAAVELIVKFSVVVPPPTSDVTESALTTVKFVEAFSQVCALRNVNNTLVKLAVDMPPLVTGMPTVVLFTFVVLFVIQGWLEVSEPNDKLASDWTVELADAKLFPATVMTKPDALPKAAIPLGIS